MLQSRGGVFVQFNEFLEYAMKKAHLTNYALAKRIGVSQSTIKNWLCGGVTPFQKQKEKVFDVFGVTDEQVKSGNIAIKYKKNPATPGGSGPIDWNKLLDGLSQDALVRLQNEIVRRIAEGGEKHK